MAGRIYLDWNATTPLRPEARAAIAAAVGARPQDVVFCSGGTEANALALTPGLHRGAGVPVQRLLVSAIEHASVLAGGRFSADAIAVINVTPSGLVDVAHLRALLDRGPLALVSVMLANNETGAIQPVAEVADIVHAAG